jgi:hypothetical protein
MSDPLLNVWEAAASSPFSPGIGKNTQFTVGFVLLAICTSGASGARVELYANDAQPSS